MAAKYIAHKKEIHHPLKARPVTCPYIRLVQATSYTVGLDWEWKCCIINTIFATSFWMIMAILYNGMGAFITRMAI